MGLKPCPFCGSLSLMLCSFETQGSILRTYYVKCNGCGASGPQAQRQQETDGEASWNTRIAQEQREANV